MKKLPYLAVLVILTGSFFFITKAQAQILYSQGSSSSQTTLSTQEAYQSLGTGLTGVTDGAGWHLETNAAVTKNIQIILVECNTNSVTTAAGIACSAGGAGTVATTTDFYVLTTTGTTTAFIQVEWANQYSLKSDKYYFLTFQQQFPYINNIFLRGTTSNIYANGSLNAFATLNSISPLLDGAFSLLGVQTVSASSYTFNLSPSNASTTVSTNVTLSFDYHADSSHNIDSYYITLSDYTNFSTSTGQITLSGTASSGDHSISRNITLTSGHTYGYQATICSSTTTICYGGPVTSFNVVSNTLISAFIGDELTQATSTNDIANSIFRRYFDFSAKPPFSIMLQVYNAWRNANDNYETATSSFPTYQLNLGDIDSGLATTSGLTTNPIANILPNFTVISKNTIQVYLSDSILNLLLLMQVIGFYASLIWYMYKRIPKFVSEL